MGLDMHLYASKYVSQYDEEQAAKFQDFMKLTRPMSATVQLEVAYWRKANAIHAWFVENVQAGVDDCGTYEVTRDQIEELVDLCKKVNQHSTDQHSHELLPTQGGFFFGSTSYDEYYYSDITQTIEMLEDVLKEFPDRWFEYRASW